MKKLLSSMLGILLAVAATMTYASDSTLDAARAAYVEAQGAFVSSMAGANMNAQTKHRNFMGYIAKIQQAEKGMEQAGSNYQSALASKVKTTPGFVDKGYAENPQLQAALAQYQAIKAEVGDATFKEAESL